MQMKDAYRAPLHAGDVLVAAPSLGDGNFARTLVFLKEHGEEGSLGLILNRPLFQSLGQLVPHADLPDDLAMLPVYFGGPVQANQFLLTLFRLHAPTNRFHCELNPEPDAIRDAIDDSECVVRAFVGYSGWGEDQLQGEVDRRDWFWTAPDGEMLKSPSIPRYWELLVNGDFRWQALRKRMPRRPELN